jgi:hypothetical protein
LKAALLILVLRKSKVVRLIVYLVNVVKTLLCVFRQRACCWVWWWWWWLNEPGRQDGCCALVEASGCLFGKLPLSSAIELPLVFLLKLNCCCIVCGVEFTIGIRLI